MNNTYLVFFFNQGFELKQKPTLSQKTNNKAGTLFTLHTGQSLSWSRSMSSKSWLRPKKACSFIVQFESVLRPLLASNSNKIIISFYCLCIFLAILNCKTNFIFLISLNITYFISLFFYFVIIIPTY